MEQENKNPAGAPSNDTTSALFVSARKKQLEQQEADRRAKEKEDQRLAAEAEVRRLEREVEERRRKVEEDSKRADEDARRIAEEARAKQAQAAANPDAVLGTQPQKKEIKTPQMPKFSMPNKAARPDGAADGGAAAAAKAPLNTKMMAIIGGVVAAVILIIVLVTTLGGGKTTLDNHYTSVSLGFELDYPTGWLVEEDAAQSALTLQTGDMAGMLMIMDATQAVSEFGGDVISAVEALMEMMVFGLVEDESDIPTPTLQKVGDYVSGGVEFETGERFIKLQAEVIEGRLILFFHAVQIGERASFEETASAIAFSLIVDPVGETDADAGMEDDGYEESAESDELMEPDELVESDELMEPDEPFDDPDAAFDAMGEFGTLGMVVFYPSSSFTLSEQTDQYMIIEDIYEHGASFMVVVPDVSTDSDAGVYRQLLDEMVNNSLAEQSDVSLGEMRDIQISGIDGYTGSEIEVSYTDSESGQAMYAVIALQFWTNESTGVQYPVVYMRAWPQNEPTYADLLRDILESREDA